MSITAYMNKPRFFKILSVFIALAVWEGIAVFAGNDMLLASPIKVISRFPSLVAEKEFLSTVLFSFLRITAGFLAAFISATVLGILAGKFNIIEILLSPYVVTVKTVPVASFIILCLIWLDFSVLTVVITFLIAFPVIYSNVLQGIKSTDIKMKELCFVYKVPFWRQLLYVYTPSIKPYLISASGVAVGMSWKAGVAAEVIGIVNGSIGEMLYNAKLYFKNADLLCWTILIILLSILTEKVFTVLLKAAFKGAEKL